MKRILVGSMHHESNSFNPIIADERDFSIKYGKDILTFESKNNSLRGIVETLEKNNYEIIPILSARAVPNGEVSFELYSKLKKEFINRALEENKKKKIDGINLALHGSMRVEGLGEAEGDLLEELRNYFKDIPIIVALDMHTTMTDKMFLNCDGYVGYKCAPHTDCYETGEHAANILMEIFNKNKLPKKSWTYIPMLVAGEQSETSTYPMTYYIEKCRKYEKEEGILAVSVLMGFPWADSEDGGMGIYVLGENEDRVKEISKTMAQEIFDGRNEFSFHTETYEPFKAYEVALEALKDKKFPIYLSDSGDNPTAGSSSDCTDFLKLILNHEKTMEIPEPVIYGGIYDPIETFKCKNKIGEEVELNLGAKFDNLTTAPIKIKGTVINYLEKWGTYKSDLAVVRMNNVDIVIAEKHVGYISPEMYEDLGLKPKEKCIIVCKLGYLTEQHKEIAKRTIMALTNGSTNEDIENINYKKVKRPIFPLDKDFSYDSEKNIKHS
ncbi:MAG: M81 family metallopeptidase [Cetobacterium sp.]|uniref:M81 family metallopeptidase n=1 Tax=Cetobacterium sp. TaxID=2071632 RepID=UPI003F3A4E7B